MLTLSKDTVVTIHESSINEAMPVFLMPLLSVVADLSSRLILDQRSGPN